MTTREREAHGAHAPTQFTCFIVESINQHDDVEVLIVNILPVVPIEKNVFCGPKSLLINVGPRFDVPETVKDTLFPNIRYLFLILYCLSLRHLLLNLPFFY